jgi:hypothetical protein
VILEHLLQSRPPIHRIDVKSQLTLISKQCVSHTVLPSCNLSGHKAQMQGVFVLGCVSGDGDLVFE